ncbi:hypothetical protein [Mucilaginibacter pineti]|uniref:hypothetical protein n=1 Tax=Mucilaginibacter pineti TaxID=1391627 RepID=UPI001968913D|nr:hypothetical protein [Mucilaginibacter pineti]
MLLVNLPHDIIINSITEGSAKKHVPIGTQAELISIVIVFLAGFFACMLVCALAGTQRKILLIVLVCLFLFADLFSVFTDLVHTSLFYRIAIVAIVPLEIWAGCGVVKKRKYIMATTLII